MEIATISIFNLPQESAVKRQPVLPRRAAGLWASSRFPAGALSRHTRRFYRPRLYLAAASDRFDRRA
jgi:hypothetical protein